jgi:hypothetical protein
MNKKTKNPELKGFEELLKEVRSNEEYINLNLAEKGKEKAQFQYELQQFLEQENARLASLEKFLTKKVPAKKNFSQTEKLIIDQMERKKIVLDKTLPILTKLTSQIQQNLAQLFNAHFS